MSFIEELRLCVEGEYLFVYKPFGVETTYVVCEKEACEVKCSQYRVVSIDELMADVEASSLGEVLATTLIPEPVRFEGDKQLFDELRETYLSRIAIEEHYRLAKGLRELAKYSYVLPHYHVFARVSRLVRIYPWLASSIVGVLSHENMLRSFIEVCKKSLKMIGCEEVSRNLFTIYEGKPARRRGWPLLRVQLTRLLPAARIEALEHPLIKDPLLLVKLKHGRLRTKILKFEDQLYKLTNVYNVLRKMRMGLGGTVTAYLDEVKGAVVKRYRTPATAKWVVAVSVALPIYPYRVLPRDRLEAEYVAHVELMNMGFPVPKPILVDIYGLRAAYEYVHGTALHHLVASNPLHPSLAEAAMLLAQIHKEGWVIGDTNPSNFVVARDSVYIVDLEQARKSDRVKHMAWDLAVLIYYSFLFNPHEAGKRAQMIAQAYISAGGSRDVVKEASKTIYALPFTPLTPVVILEKARKALAHVASTG